MWSSLSNVKNVHIMKRFDYAMIFDFFSFYKKHVISTVESLSKKIE
jgi:hypothetical protein